MGAINWPAAQSRLHVVTDGNPGPVTYAALLAAVAGRATALTPALGASLAAHAPAFRIDASPSRLARFLGQTCHESMSFALLHELWGPTSQQARYEGSHDLGNTQPGDGFRFRGRGLIQITGRWNYSDFGHALDLDLVGAPQLAEQPDAAVLTALHFWSVRNLNALADMGDDTAITRKINGGLNGLAERVAFTQRASAILS